MPYVAFVIRTGTLRINFDSSKCIFFFNLFSELNRQLNRKVYGQHLVIEPVIKHLKAHAKDNPSKALALSFHGWTGTGKNFVSAIVAEQMYRLGMKSKYVHLISATKEFPHEEMVPLYKVCLLLYLIDHEI